MMFLWKGLLFQLCKAAICQWEGRELSCCNLSISITMHNLKHRAILGALCRLARVRAQHEPSESEYKTNDGNGCNYIYMAMFSFGSQSHSVYHLSPCLSPFIFNSLWKTATWSLPLPLFFHFSVYLHLSFSPLVCFAIQVSADRWEERALTLNSANFWIYSHGDTAVAKTVRHQSDGVMLLSTITWLIVWHL